MPKYNTLAAKIRKHLRFRELGKRNYAKSDAVLEEVLLEMEPGDTVKLNRETVAVLVDNFEDKNKVYRAHGIARYEFKTTDG